MKSADVFAGTGTIGVVNSGSGFSSVASFVSDFTWGLEFMFIPVIGLKGRNYAPWTKSIEFYMMAK